MPHLFTKYDSLLQDFSDFTVSTSNMNLVKFNDNNPHKIVIAKWIEYGIRNGFLPPTFTLNGVTPFSVV